MLGTTRQRIATAGLVAFETTQPPGLATAGHHHDGGSLCLVLAGGFEELAPVPRRFARGDLVLTAAGHAQDLRFGPSGARCFVAEWSPRFITAAGIGHLPNETTTVDEPALAGLAWRASAELATGEPGAPLGVEEAVLALLADLPGPAGPFHDNAGPGWVRRAVEVIRDGYRRPLSLSRIAAEVGVHRVTLAREFRRRTGRSVGETLRRLRVGIATDLLARTELSLVEVALAAGFADQSHLCRMVRRSTGRTPGWLRRRCAGASIVQDEEPSLGRLDDDECARRSVVRDRLGPSRRRGRDGSGEQRPPGGGDSLSQR
jgi:AraC family transcriptional regulator